MTLDTATDEELEDALRKRREQRGKPQVNSVSDDSIPRNPQGRVEPRSEREGAERPRSNDELAMDVFGVFTGLDPSKDLDGQGKPYLERVNERLGYQISQKELDDIWSAYKG